MFTGGTSYSDKSRQIVRFAGLMIPVVLVLYGILIQYAIIPSANYLNDGLFFGISLAWLVLAVIVYLFPSTSSIGVAFRLTGYHILAAMYVLFVAGFTMPFVACWLILIVASNIYFGRLGTQVSIVAFALTVAVDAILLHSTIPTILVTDLMVLVAVLISSLTIIAINRTQEIDQAELSRSQAQANLQRDRVLTIVNNLADAILSTDKNGIIRIYNAASLNLLDTNDSLNGHKLDEVLNLRDSDGNPVILLDELIRSRGVVTRDDLHFNIGEDEDIRLEATYSPIRSSYSRTKDGQSHDGYIIILRDVTKAKSLEEERDEFISVVSHELRTPITIAEGTISNAQLIMERGVSKPEVLRDSMKSAHDQVLFLAKMVNDLSTLSRAERGVADASEDIDVRELVQALYTEYAPQAEAKGLHFNLDAGAHLGQLNASRLYLHELLQNFITNSLKYTNEGSITLRVSQKDDRVFFAVEDTGIGISKSDQKKIFQKFYRAEDYRTRETSGTGLGLYVGAKLAKKLGCIIELSSRINHGSTFSFSLPSLTKK